MIWNCHDHENQGLKRGRIWSNQQWNSKLKRKGRKGCQRAIAVHKHSVGWPVRSLKAKCGWLGVTCRSRVRTSRPWQECAALKLYSILTWMWETCLGLFNFRNLRLIAVLYYRHYKKSIFLLIIEIFLIITYPNQEGMKRTRESEMKNFTIFINFTSTYSLCNLKFDGLGNSFI